MLKLTTVRQNVTKQKKHEIKTCSAEIF